MEDITYKEIEAASAGIFQRIKEIKIENVLLKVNEDIKLFEEQNSVVKQNKTDCLSRYFCI